MPHAALWVVQPYELHSSGCDGHVSMPHAALWVVQPRDCLSFCEHVLGFNAARGFVGGAALSPRRITTPLRVSMPHAALWVVQRCGLLQFLVLAEFQCRTRLCGWCSALPPLRSPPAATFQCRTRLCGWCSFTLSNLMLAIREFQCRTRLCGWCSNTHGFSIGDSVGVSMPHAALWVVQQRENQDGRTAGYDVSMPHAALWVVQLRRSQFLSP